MKSNKLQKNKIKNEKGAITLFVLATMMFLLIMLTISYMEIKNELISQEKKVTTIQKEYSTDDIDAKYDEVISKEELESNADNIDTQYDGEINKEELESNADNIDTQYDEELNQEETKTD